MSIKSESVESPAVSVYPQRPHQMSLRDSAVAKLLMEGRLPDQYAVQQCRVPLDLSARRGLDDTMDMEETAYTCDSSTKTDSDSGHSPVSTTGSCSSQPTNGQLRGASKRKRRCLQPQHYQLSPDTAGEGSGGTGESAGGPRASSPPSLCASPSPWKCQYCPFSAKDTMTLYSHYQFHQQLLTGSSNAAKSHLEWISAYQKERVAEEPAIKVECDTSPPTAAPSSSSSSSSGDSGCRPLLPRPVAASSQPSACGSPVLRTLLINSSTPGTAPPVAPATSGSQLHGSASGFLRSIVQSIMQNGTGTSTATTSTSTTASISGAEPSRGQSSTPIYSNLLRSVAQVAGQVPLMDNPEDTSRTASGTQNTSATPAPSKMQLTSQTAVPMVGGVVFPEAERQVKKLTPSSHLHHPAENRTKQNGDGNGNSGRVQDKDSLLQNHDSKTSLRRRDLGSCNDHVLQHNDHSITSAEPQVNNSSPEKTFHLEYVNCEGPTQIKQEPMEEDLAQSTCNTATASKSSTTDSAGDMPRNTDARQQVSQMDCPVPRLGPGISAGCSLDKDALAGEGLSLLCSTHNVNKTNVQHSEDSGKEKRAWCKYGDDKICDAFHSSAKGVCPRPLESDTAQSELQCGTKDAGIQCSICSCKTDDESQSSGADTSGRQGELSYEACLPKPTSHVSVQCERMCDVLNEQCLGKAPDGGTVQGISLNYCPHCDITFGDEVLYSIHMGCHSHVDPFRCNVCGKVSINKYGFYTHIMRGHQAS